MKSILFFFLTFELALSSQPSVPVPANLKLSSPYIINGEDAPDGAFPYMLSLNLKKRNNSHMCGASILTKDWALTAAHCCEGHAAKELGLYSGSNVLYSDGNHHNVELFKIHTNYTPQQNWIYDACLLKVKDPFVFGEKVQQVTLPPQDWPVNDGDLLNVTGWGYMANQTIPKKLQLGRDFVALSTKKCKALTSFGHPSYLCVLGGKKGQGVCNGDSGSPIVKNGTQVGIASWVFTPCGFGLPDFYARVPHMVNWIVSELGPNADELKFVKEN